MGGWVRVRDTEEREYAVYVTEDITPVYERVERLALRIALVSFGCILGGLALIAALVHRTLRPLAELRRSAARIAQGQYGERTSAAGGDEVGELAESFNAMADSVQAHIRELTETAERQRLFISGVTHEFKTPLTAILLNADSLQNVCLDEQAQAEAVERMVGQCAWLERLVQKLLKLITLREGIDRRPCDTAELIERVRESTEENLNRRGVTLAVRGDTEEMELDADLMQSVLVNLIDNAAKASSPGQTVTLTVREDGFTVEDQGEGIPAAELERVREPFYMVDRSRSKQRGGLGLGLALANEIVQAHGGTLDIESAVGEGTAVRVELWQK